MHNITAEVKAGKLVLTMDISKPMLDRAPPSASGKTKLVATTGAAQPVQGVPGLTYAINVMLKVRG